MSVKKLIMGTAALLLSGIGLTCAAVRIAQSGISPPIGLLAAEMTLPTGTADFPDDIPAVEAASQELSSPEEVSAEEASPSPAAPKPAAVPTVPPEPSDSGFEASAPTAEELRQYEKSHEGEQQYPVRTFTTTLGNESYQNIQVRNSSSTDIDIEAELQAELGFRLTKTDQPQVLIYHTHTSESFLKYDTGYFYESYYPRSSDPSENVCAVGEELAKQLNAAGIVTLHDTTVHDDPSYSGAYDRSFDTVSRYLEEYPTIKVVLDIHRDGIGSDEEKSKPVFQADGRQAAQVMVLAGYNEDGCEEFQDWEYNLRFALQIQNEASRRYPDMMRPLYFSDFMYNMNVNTGSLLIEVGSESNTVEEVRYSGYLLGKVLAAVLAPAEQTS